MIEYHSQALCLMIAYNLAAYTRSEGATGVHRIWLCKNLRLLKFQDAGLLHIISEGKKSLNPFDIPTLSQLIARSEVQMV